MRKKLVWIAEAIAMVCDLFLLITFLPISVVGDAWFGPGMTNLELIGLMVGVIINWILLVIFIKKVWNKVILLLLFLPVVWVCMGLAEGKFLQALKIVLFILGLSMLLQPNYYHQFLRQRFKKKISPLLIRIIGGIMAIASVLLRF